MTIFKRIELLTINTTRPALIILGLSIGLCYQATNAQTAPPSLGQETKGTPAVTESQPEPESTPEKTEEVEEKSTSPLGTATITESRRENGQLYMIELEHSSGSKQYIEEHDSDGKIESTPNDIEETPNLPKWKLGSW